MMSRAPIKADREWLFPMIAHVFAMVWSGEVANSVSGANLWVRPCGSGRNRHLRRENGLANPGATTNRFQGR